MGRGVLWVVLLAGGSVLAGCFASNDPASDSELGLGEGAEAQGGDPGQGDVAWYAAGDVCQGSCTPNLIIGGGGGGASLAGRTPLTHETTAAYCGPGVLESEARIELRYGNLEGRVLREWTVPRGLPGGFGVAIRLEMPFEEWYPLCQYPLHDETNVGMFLVVDTGSSLAECSEQDNAMDIGGSLICQANPPDAE